MPLGWAVSTPFTQPDGDPVMFFVVTVSPGVARLEDDGAQVAMLEAAGVPLGKKGARFDAFSEMLVQHRATYDDDAGMIRTEDMSDEHVPAAAIGFMALMLRIHDLVLLTTERVKRTWREDAMRDIHATFDGKATVEDNAPVSPKLSSFTADAVIRADGISPVAVFLATTDPKGLQALVLKMELEKYQDVKCTVVLMVERAKENALREATYALALNRLDAAFPYRGAEAEAMASIGKIVQPAHGALQ